MALVTWVFVGLILLLVVRAAGGEDHAGLDHRRASPGGPRLLLGRARRHVGPDTVFDAVGAPQPGRPGRGGAVGAARGHHGGRPVVVYVGAEFCPYCAAARWALVVALGRFGSFADLGATSSSTAEVFPGTPTFSFDGTTYRSHYVSFASVEEYGDRLVDHGTGRLPPPAPAHARGTGAPPALRHRARSCPAPGRSPSSTSTTVLVVSGAGIGFSPGVLQGPCPWPDVANDLSDPSKAVTQAVLGAANTLSAAICAATGGQPGCGVPRPPGSGPERPGSDCP